MTLRFKALITVVILFVFAAVSQAHAHVASVVARTSPCTVIDTGETVQNPPSVQMWRMPKNDRGVHELILSVHRDGDRFCYNYELDGATRHRTPVIHVRPGESFAIRLVNDISSQAKGEFVNASSLPHCAPMPIHEGPLEHFSGYLNHTVDFRPVNMKPVDTNLHVHGFEGSPYEDNIFLSTLSSPMHACEYVYHLPATQPPGTYYYHPHPHGVSYEEVSGGLAGVWIVDPATPEVPPADEHVLILRDAVPSMDDQKDLDERPLVLSAIAYNAALRPAPPVPYDPFNPPDWRFDIAARTHGVSWWRYACMGTRTDVRISVNDSATPARLNVRGGSTQVLRIISSLSDGSKELSLRDRAGNVVPMKIAEIDGVPAGGDSNRPLSRYIGVSHYELPPASRISVLVNVHPGDELSLHTDKHCEGFEGARQLSYDLVRIYGVAAGRGASEVVASKPLTRSDDQTPAAQLLAYARAHRSLIRRRAITYTQYIFPAPKPLYGRYGFFITDTTNRDFHEHTYDPQIAAGSPFPVNPDIRVKQGTIEEWYLINATPDRHSFHIHQMSYVLENGPGGLPVSLDVTDVPSGTIIPNPHDPDHVLVHPTITKVLIDFRHVPKGTFVFHCHMLFHEDNGMMGIIRVE